MSEETMLVMSLEDAQAHYGHEITVARYVNLEGEAVNVAIECVTCYQVLADADI